MAKLSKKIDNKAVDKILAIIANNPMISPERLMFEASNLGYDPRELIDTALGSVKYEKSGANLQKDFVDVLNEVYKEDVTPGDRFVIDPREARTKKGKEVAQALEGNVGISSSLEGGKSRYAPDYIAIKKPYSESEKLKAISDAGHEMLHAENFLIRPGFQSKTTQPYSTGHHYGTIYEPSELIREVRNLPVDEKVKKEVLKQSQKVGAKIKPFSKLLSILGPAGALIGAGTALKSGDTLGAALEAGSLADPTGIVDVAAEVNRRSKLSPEEQEDVSKEDYYSAMPLDVANEQRVLDSLNMDNKNTKYNKLRSNLK